MFSRRSLLKVVAGAALTIPLAGWLTYQSINDDEPTDDARGIRETSPVPSTASLPGSTDIDPPDAYDTIQQAIDDTMDESDAEVRLPAGEYVLRETLRIEHPLRLVGAGIDQTTVSVERGMNVIEISDTYDVEVSGLTILGMHDDSDLGSGVRARGVENLTIQDCRFTNISDTGVLLRRVHNSRITGCEFSTIRMSGIRLDDPGDGDSNADIRIERNVFNNVVTSRQVGHSAIQAQHESRHERIVVQDNYIESLFVGIGLDSLDESVVANNRIVGNGERGEGVAFAGSNNHIVGNMINRCYAAGILQWALAYRDNADNLIEGNTCWDNGQGIAIVCGEAGTVVEDVTIVGNRCYSESEEYPQNFGVQSYLDGTEDFEWVNVAIVENDLRGNAVGAINLVPPSEARIENNLT